MTHGTVRFALLRLTVSIYDSRRRFGILERDEWQITGHDSFNMSIAHHDRYSAYLVVCGRGGSFYGYVTSTFLNRVPEGDLTQHLPINQAMLPALYTVSVVPHVSLRVELCCCSRVRSVGGVLLVPRCWPPPLFLSTFVHNSLALLLRVICPWFTLMPCWRIRADT